jgi:hypothetical protein
MQPQTDELASQVDAVDAQKGTLTSFTLYEEFSQIDLAETIRTRRVDYDQATKERRRELEKDVEAEVKDFCKWLEDTKSLKPLAAHYCAISLKSLLLGISVGLQIAQLFNTPLNSLINDQTQDMPQNLRTF